MFMRQQAEKLHQIIKDGNVKEVENFVNKQCERGKDLCCLEVPRDGTSIHVAARAGHPEIIEYILDSGIDVNLQTSEGHVVAGFCPLHCAVKAGNIDAVDMLLSSGANVNLQEHDGQTALHMACQINRFDIVKVLIRNGADVNIKDNSGQSSLQTSILRGSDDISYYLVRKGADVHVTDSDGQSALHYAAEWDNAELVQLLIKKGSQVNSTDNDGRSPLHLAASDEMYELLIENGADETIRDRRAKKAKDAKIDTNKEEYQNINKALGQHMDKVVKRGPNAARLVQEKTGRMFSPGPPIPEAELKAAKTNMLMELQKKTPLKEGETLKSPRRISTQETAVTSQGLPSKMAAANIR